MNDTIYVDLFVNLWASVIFVVDHNIWLIHFGSFEVHLGSSQSSKQLKQRPLKFGSVVVDFRIILSHFILSNSSNRAEMKYHPTQGTFDDAASEKKKNIDGQPTAKNRLEGYSGRQELKHESDSIHRN